MANLESLPDENSKRFIAILQSYFDEFDATKGNVAKSAIIFDITGISAAITG